MKKLQLKKLLIAVLIFFASGPQVVNSYTNTTTCSSIGARNITGIGERYPEGISQIEIGLNASNLSNGSFKLVIASLPAGDNIYTTGDLSRDASGNLSFSISDQGSLSTPEGRNTRFTVNLYRDDVDICRLGTYTVERGDLSCENILVYQLEDDGGNTGQACYGGETTGGCLDDSRSLRVQAIGVREGLAYYTDPIDVHITNPWFDHQHFNNQTLYSGNTQVLTAGPATPGLYTIKVRKASMTNWGAEFCSLNFNISEECGECNARRPEDVEDAAAFSLCSQLPAGSESRRSCETCAGGTDGTNGVWTAIGCISREPTSILTALLSTGITIGGGTALLMIIGAGFIFSTSSGDPKKIEQAKELVTSAIVGLIFIIFSVTLLQYIGVTILRIPGIGG